MTSKKMMEKVRSKMSEEEIIKKAKELLEELKNRSDPYQKSAEIFLLDGYIDFCQETRDEAAKKKLLKYLKEYLDKHKFT